MSDEHAKDENRNSKFETRRNFRASIFEFRSFLAHHSSLITCHCSLLTALCLLTCSSFACRRQVPLKPYTAYVVNYQSATLAAVNLADFRVIASLPVSPQPERVLLRPGARQLYVVSATGKISVVTFPPLQSVTTLDVGKSAKDLVFSPDGFSAYVLDPADHQVAFLSCQTPWAAGLRPPSNYLEGAIPTVSFRLRVQGSLADLVLSPDGKTLVVSSASPDLLTFISTETRQMLGTVEVGQSPGPMVILPDNSKVFVADTGEEKISAADVAARRLLSHIEIGAHPTALLLKPDGGELFVLAAPSSTLVIVDAFHDNVEQTFPLGRNPVAGIFRQDMSVLYIANAGDGSVLALDVPNRQVLATPHVGMEPRALALTPDPGQRLLVVADRAASSLAILHADLASLGNDRSVLITTVPVGTSPVDVVVPDFIG
jgi:DNA-binding beta-propeller fold protein YncE